MLKAPWTIKLVFCTYFLSYLLIGDVSFWLYSALTRSAAKQNMEEMIENNEYYGSFRIIKISNEANEIQLDWIDHEHEFILNEEMYDIVSKTVSKDSTTYYCIKDDHETAINHAEKDYAKKENSAARNIKFSFAKDAKKYYTGTPAVNSPLMTVSYFTIPDMIPYRNHIHEIPPPPPERNNS